MNSLDPPRLANSSDLPAIRRVIAAAYAKYLDLMDRPPAPVLNDYRAEADAGEIWVAGEPLVGVLVLIVTSDSLLVENVAVDPAAQGTGLGRALLEFAERKAAERGLSRMTLYTHEIMVENLAIYAKLGYREEGRRTEDGYRRVYLEKRLPA
jgi:GNAT superfamily N-acetyltransferase